LEKKQKLKSLLQKYEDELNSIINNLESKEELIEKLKIKEEEDYKRLD